MPAEHDLDPPSMTEDERLTKRRYQAYFAFEMMLNHVDGSPEPVTLVDDQLRADSGCGEPPVS